jgi:hypothetical protein
VAGGAGAATSADGQQLVNAGIADCLHDGRTFLRDDSVGRARSGRNDYSLSFRKSSGVAHHKMD